LRSFKFLLPDGLAKFGGLSAFLLLNLFLLLFSPSPFPLVWGIHLFFVFILGSFLWAGSFWGILVTVWSMLAASVVALTTREFYLLWMPLEFLLFGAVAHRAFAQWMGEIRAEDLQEERLEEQLNTLKDELKHLEEAREGLRDRLRRYQQLRQVANVFSASFSLEELIQNIVQATGQLVIKGDLVLLFLVNPQALTLELKSVWRRSGSVTVKAKTGDPFDLWVMRQAQPLLVEEPSADFRFPAEASRQLGRPLGSLLAVPLFSEERLLGVLRVESSRPRGLEMEDLRLVRILADLASLGIENSQLYQRMVELAITDDLTGLAVRKHFQKRLGEEIARSKVLQVPIGLLLIDIDHFKVYNDTFGHSAGDKLLKHLASILRQLQRPGEVIARFGGEEFVFLLPGVDLEQSLHRAEAIRSRVERAQIELRRSLTQTTVSVGVAVFPRDGDAPEPLLKTADDRLYRAKAGGRNQVCSS